MIGDWWSGLGNAAYAGWLGQAQRDQQFNTNLNQMAAQYNQQYIVGSSASVQDLLNARPGGIVRVSHPSAVQAIYRPKPAPDCQGCGAPLKAHIHQCEYCRRSI